jgi:hypothetical protein
MMQAKSKYIKNVDAKGLAIIQLENQVAHLQTQIKRLAEGEKVSEDLPNKLTILKDTLASIKLRQSRGDFRTDDKFRVLALENEIGRTILKIEGTL